MYDLSKLLNLRLGNIRGAEGMKAPHKPVLLLSIIALIESKKVTENKFFLDHSLISYFSQLWKLLVSSDRVQPKVFLPFYHLTNDFDIWTIQLRSTSEVSLTSSYSPKSISALLDTIEYASLNDELFQHLAIKENRLRVWGEIVSKYFNDLESYGLLDVFPELTSNDEFCERDLLNNLKEPLGKYWKEVDLTRRAAYFKKRVPEIYEYKCAVSGMRVAEPFHRTLLDACHIEPWKKNYNDSIMNGISLSPSIHRAFDNFMFTIDEHYKIVVSKKVVDLNQSKHSLNFYNGKNLHLPNNKRLLPDQGLLEVHRKEFFLRQRD